MRFFVMTLFPDIINSVISDSILKRAIDNNVIDIHVYNIRDYSKNKHKKVDDYPYGGGAGMVMTPQPIIDTYENIKRDYDLCDDHKVIYMSPKGSTFDQKSAKRLSNSKDIVLLCGHYEGVDQRVIDMIVDEEISIGDFILTGGELASMVIIDSVSRLIPGVLGSEDSSMDESFENNLLEYPQYTRPEDFCGHKVPEVLLSGNHKKIEQWRNERSLEITKERRKDLYYKYCNNLQDEV